ncbi:MAG TPA: terminase [Aurantimonas coralicida]|uniref:Terminase n=2 Tax=root TaxID=1 RepID=A0A9C9TGG0_9HYPH|nr:terminase [Aurantimonas coralicida]HET99672.1 terminase [Aurantimonas coralicida]
MNLLTEIVERVAAVDEKTQAKLNDDVVAAAGNIIDLADGVWLPNPGSQTEAYFCEADEIGYGGEAGPGKTDLLIGLSLTAHHRSLILRRTNKEAGKLVERYFEILGHRRGLNTVKGTWELPSRLIECGGVQHEDDKQKYKGTPRDLIGWDEVVDFTRSQYLFVNQWNRTTDPNQRCRVVATFNPPIRPVGLWVIEHWGPWLDPKHPNPAKSGEIRWFTAINGRDTEVDGRGPHIVDGEPIMAKSRTFIRGYLHENPDLAETGYDATRAAAPKGLREIYRAGDFEAALADVPNQLIPMAWVRAAQARWTDSPPLHAPMCSMGVDASGGGDDPMMIAMRYDGWYAPLIEVPGAELKVARMGSMSAGIVVSHRRNNAVVVVDLGGGYGGALYEKLHENNIECVGFKGAEGSNKRTQDRRHLFVNTRTAAYYGFREALDPDQPNGSPIALPDDPRLVGDLTSATFEVTPNGIKLEPKEKVVERLGRSTDSGDAVVMAWWAGATVATHGTIWRKALRNQHRPAVHRGHDAQRRK